MNRLETLVCIAALFGAGLDFNDDAPKAPERDYGLTCLALVGWTEARDQDDVGLALPMLTVVNRATDPLERWPRTICDVALQPGQYLGIDRWPPPRHPERIDAVSWERALDMASRVIAGTAPIPPECIHATGFDQAPIARNDIRFVCHHDAHTFYADPPLPIAAH